MKKTILLLLGMLILVCGTAFAQDYPKAEVFGGFSVLTVGDSSNPFENQRDNFFGFQADGAFNFHENLGVEADFGGQYKGFDQADVTAHFYQYLFGPRFTLRQEKANVFAHVLFGGATAGVAGHNENAFAMGIGGGLDVNVNDRFAVRIVQFDWIPIHDQGEWYNNTVRFGFGIVIK